LQKESIYRKLREINGKEGVVLDDVMTLSEVATYLKLSDKTVQKMVKAREIPCARVGNQWRFMKTMLDDWLLSRMEVVPQNDLSRIIEREADLVPLSRLTGNSLINLNLRAENPREVLEALAAKAAEAGYVNNIDSLVKGLLKREKMISTAVGEGIAIPHLRTPDARLVEGPALVIGLVRDGVDFGASDGSRTRLFFLLLSDSEVVHLRIMAKLARLLRIPGVSEELMQAGTGENIMEILIKNEKMIREE